MKININWHSKVFWVSLVSLLIVLVQQVLAIFSIELPAGLSDEIMSVVNTLLTIGGLTGVIYDTTKGGQTSETK